MTIAEFFVTGTPVAQQRPKFSTRGGFVKAYDQKQCVDYKSYVRHCATEYMGRNGVVMVDRKVPLSMRVTMFLQKPKSAPKTRISYPVAKPDCDNVLKGIQDALESVLYMADQQIVDVWVRKVYASEKVGVQIKVMEYEE